jgi:hypothetical protein
LNYACQLWPLLPNFWIKKRSARRKIENGTARAKPPPVPKSKTLFVNDFIQIGEAEIITGFRRLTETDVTLDTQQS